MPSIFETINQRATAIKNDRWRQYKPLSRFQLTDYDAAADDESENLHVTIIALTADPTPDKRSTRRTAVRYKQFKVVKRPTEVQAITRAQTCPDESPVIRIEPIETRWCILCKDRHPVSMFIQNKRYIHGLSYACRDKLLAGYHGRRWRMAV